MTLTVQPSKHILIVPVHMWGHVRPLCIASARMVKLRPTLTLTICIASRMYDRARTEIMRDFAHDDKEPLSRIRMISVYEGKNTLDPEALVDNFLAVWNKLSSGETVSAKSLDGVERSVNLREAPLNATLIDSYALEIFMALQKQRESSSTPLHLNIYTWLPVATNCIPPLFGVDMWPLAEAIAEREGISFNDAAHRICAEPVGRLVECAGMPPMYDHEYSPQAFPSGAERCGRIFIKVPRMLAQTDGILTIDAADYQPEVTAAMRAQLAETGRKMYYAGPLIANAESGTSSQRKQSAQDTADDLPAEHGQQGVLDFMDAQLKARGERSVMYVSFGSMFWPLDPAKLLVALEVLMEQNVPFVITRPSPFAQIPDDFMKKLEEYGQVYIADWVPQQALLHHPAMGWCLTHGGHNTTLECITAGVPMIVWPIVMDQPTNAVHLSDGLNVAYELIEVRNGHGLGRIYRTGYTPVGTLDAVREELRDVLARAFGADGEAKRGRVEALKERLLSAWQGSGSGQGRLKDGSGIGRREVEAFLDDACARVPFTGGGVAVAA
ncbi:glycosyltransferase family 1 protein [Trametes coccinea BRFM310]|uniref:Glycosyltransferase family 1 protein n=1 Tax=Trametes coccinea (strain BRFM310) TaxID=1353009 RepID=A0A1Y2J4R0_TRAC3|nr:glycosyltransferase family 1 protein [Trametes coccinea BRFM310]